MATKTWIVYAEYVAVVVNREKKVEEEEDIEEHPRWKWNETEFKEKKSHRKNRDGIQLEQVNNFNYLGKIQRQWNLKSQNNECTEQEFPKEEGNSTSSYAFSVPLYLKRCRMEK